MNTKVITTELGRSLTDIMDRVHHGGETFDVHHDGEVIASLSPPCPSLGIPMHLAAERLRNVASPGDGFADDLEAVQSSQPRVEVPSWDS